jgi:NAD(P)-dependent dehydrogenase (short-subunit alcohol dehydrogenase family)
MKRVFITGASSGIGLATAKTLLENGHNVWGTARDPARLLTHDRFRAVKMDLRDREGLEAAYRSAERDADGFDVLINNAGSGHFGAAEFLPTDEIVDQFQLLFFGHVRLMQLALEGMQKGKGGLIINVTSLAARLPVPFMTAYNAGKAAMAAFTMSTQLEIGQSGVRLVDLQPADIRTAFNDAVVRTKHDERYAEKIATTWKLVEKNMQDAPEPGLVARRILKLMDESNPPPRVTVGGTFQAQIAPIIYRLLPQRTRLWGLKRYYQLP